MKRFIQTKAWEDGNCKWELRERAAAGIIWEIGPKNILIPLTDNNQIPKEVLVHHLPNNYVNNRKSEFGEIPVKRLIV